MHEVLGGSDAIGRSDAAIVGEVAESEEDNAGQGTESVLFGIVGGVVVVLESEHDGVFGVATVAALDVVVQHFLIGVENVVEVISGEVLITFWEKVSSLVGEELEEVVDGVLERRRGEACVEEADET